MTPLPDPDLAGLAATLHEQRRQTAIDLIGSLWSNPPRGAALATAANVTSVQIQDFDLSVIFEILTLGSALPVEALLRVARLALQRGDRWTSVALPGSRGPLWDDVTLVGLATYHPHAELLPAYAKRLASIDARLAAATEMLAQAREVLANAAARPAIAAAARPRIVRIPRNARGAA